MVGVSAALQMFVVCKGFLFGCSLGICGYIVLGFMVYF